MAELACMITGHRPHKLGGYAPNNPLLSQIQEHLLVTLTTLRDRGYEITGITGMALGVDQAFARACLAARIPFHAYIPFPGQENRWPESSRRTYRDLLTQAAREVLVTPHVTSDADVILALLHRNTAMVQAAQAGIAIWDGSPGGTADAVRKIRSAQLPLLILHPHRPYHPGEVDRWIAMLPRPSLAST